MRQHYEDMDFLAWRIGWYDAQGMGLFWGKNNSYPDQPETRAIRENPKGEAMSDGAKFAAFAAAHRRAIAERKQKPRG